MIKISEIVLYITLLVILIIMIMEKNILNTIVFFSVFSLILAFLYFYNKAPDVALAEIAIGSAILPLIFIISISKQKEYVVISKVKDDFINSKDGEFCGYGYDILKEFTKSYKLNLTIVFDEHFELEQSVTGVFKKIVVDLIVEKGIKNDIYILKGRRSSLLLNKLNELIQEYDNIVLLKMLGDEIDE
ncbi:MAG: Na(+)/H(+) antiporter subunit B [Alkaliphilus sp.]